MKIEKKTKACANATCTGAECETKVDDKKNVTAEEIQECDKTESVESTEDINKVTDEPEEEIEAKKNLGLAKQFYQLASEHVKNAIDALGDAASNGDRYAKQEIADLSVILFDLNNLQRM